MSSRLQPHHSLPAPVVHAGFSVSQSKSHVLAGVQDAYWSDEEAEDAECPLCLEEMDISDLNFKPCICGYQICRFCWHHIKENLNKRCPACRRVYTDEGVEFKAIATQDHKRLTQQKKQRERERKELDALGRRHLANVRVVQRNVVYVVGIGPRFAKEELISTLRSNEYFGQYGKITKILLVKRTPSGGGAPVVGLYITYYRREDATRAIAAVDGSPSPGGGRDVMRASHGTTKYCMAFLRGVSCSDHACMNLHEWGDEKDCFTKEDLTTLKHTMKTTESRSRNAAGKKPDETDGLPRAASWANKSTVVPQATSHTPSTPTRQSTRRGTSGSNARQRTSAATIGPTTPSDSRTTTARDRRSAASTKTPSQTSSSRPPTPGNFPLPQRPVTPGDVKVLRQKKEVQTGPLPSASPAPSVAAESDLGSGSHDVPAPPSPAVRPQSADSAESSVLSVPPVPAVPPGLSAPPGIPTPSRPPRLDSASPGTPLLASQSSYQMSNAARALLEDVKSRREYHLDNTVPLSPFPDLDDTLRTLTDTNNEYGGFSFNLDPKLANLDDADVEALELPDFEAEAAMPFRGSYMDAFPALRTPASPVLAGPPGLPFPHNPSRSIYDPLTARPLPIPQPLERQSTGGSIGYMGSFNPFADSREDSASHSRERDEERKVSRFGFARGRQGSGATASPLHVSSPLSGSNSDLGHSFYSSPAVSNSAPAPAESWNTGYAQQQSGATSSPLVQHAQAAMLSPLVPHAQVNSPLIQHVQAQQYSQQHSRFQPFDNSANSISVSEAQLREFIQSSRERAGSSSVAHAVQADQQGSSAFNDPAIMSARFAAPTPDVFAQLSYGPPPGLAFAAGMPTAQGSQNMHVLSNSTESSAVPSHVSTATAPMPPALIIPPLSPTDFPALASAVTDPTSASPMQDAASGQDTKAFEKAERKAAKKALAAEKAAERQRIAQEKAALKTAEKTRVAAEKAAEKEKAAALKAEQEKVLKEKVERDMERAKAEKERQALLAEKAILQAEKGRLEKEKEKEKEKAKKLAAAIKQAEKQAQRPEPAAAAAKVPVPVSQVPLLSKKPKKNKPTTKPIRVSKEEEHLLPDDGSTLPSASASEAPHLPQTQPSTSQSSSNNSRSHSIDFGTSSSIKELFQGIQMRNPGMDLPTHPFFDIHRVNPAAKVSVEYGPLVHALSAMLVGGFFADTPSASSESAVLSFEALLITLRDTISELSELLPRSTWGESSSFDEMLKRDEYPTEEGDETSSSKDGDFAALEEIERRARSMEVQLSKLEELHRDVNTAAVRAVLSFNDHGGWDRHGFLPHSGHTLQRFDNIGMVEENGVFRSMTADELEKKLAVAKEAALFAEAEVREVMDKLQTWKPVDEDYY